MSNNCAASDLLRSFRDRIVRLEEEKKAIAEDIKSVFTEAKGQGFDTKSLRAVVKRSMEGSSETAKRKETEAITELYLASLGMLDGTPLGDKARERALPPEKDDRDDDPAGGDGAPAGDPPAGDPPPAVPPRGALTEQDMADARGRGSEDCRKGKRIIDNPFTAGDPRRAAWDEGHCQESGSDGMEIPESWRRKAKASPSDADKGTGA